MINREKGNKKVLHTPSVKKMGLVLSTNVSPPNQLVKNKMKIPTEIIKFRK
jgi:hypothetical protein